MIQNHFLNDLVPLDTFGVRLAPGARVSLCFSFDESLGNVDDSYTDGVGLIISIVNDRASVLWSQVPNQKEALKRRISIDVRKAIVEALYQIQEVNCPDAIE